MSDVIYPNPGWSFTEHVHMPESTRLPEGDVRQRGPALICKLPNRRVYVCTTSDGGYIVVTKKLFNRTARHIVCTHMSYTSEMMHVLCAMVGELRKRNPPNSRELKPEVGDE